MSNNREVAIEIREDIVTWRERSVATREQLVATRERIVATKESVFEEPEEPSDKPERRGAKRLLEFDDDIDGDELFEDEANEENNDEDEANNDEDDEDDEDEANNDEDDEDDENRRTVHGTTMTLYIAELMFGHNASKETLREAIKRITKIAEKCRALINNGQNAILAGSGRTVSDTINKPGRLKRFPLSRKFPNHFHSLDVLVVQRDPRVPRCLIDLRAEAIITGRLPRKR